MRTVATVKRSTKFNLVAVVAFAVAVVFFYLQMIWATLAAAAVGAAFAVAAGRAMQSEPRAPRRHDEEDE